MERELVDGPVVFGVNATDRPFYVSALWDHVSRARFLSRRVEVIQR